MPTQLVFLPNWTAKLIDDFLCGFLNDVFVIVVFLNDAIGEITNDVNDAINDVIGDAIGVRLNFNTPDESRVVGDESSILIGHRTRHPTI